MGEWLKRWEALRDLLKELTPLRVREIRLLTYGLEQTRIRVQIGVDGPLTEKALKDIIEVMKKTELEFLWISEAYNSIWLNFEAIEIVSGDKEV